jgi:hypothetical protein
VLELSLTGSFQGIDSLSLGTQSICNLRSIINAHINETSRFTSHRTKQSIVAVHDVGARAEQQERATAMRAFGFALSKALVTDERALLVANETTKRHALERPLRQISAHLARRDETRQNRCPYAEKLQKDRIPLECADVEQMGPRCIAHFANMLTGTHATEQILSSLSMTGARGV